MRNSGTNQNRGNHVHLDIELLSAYIDGEVTPDEATRIAQHLPLCSRCSGELESLRWTVNLLHEIPPVPVPHSFAVRLTDLEPAKPVRRRFTLPNWLVNSLQWATVATAVLAILLFTADLLDIGRLAGAPTLMQAAQSKPAASIAVQKALAPEAENEAAPPAATVVTEREEAAELAGEAREVPAATVVPGQAITPLHKQPLISEPGTETTNPTSVPQAGTQSERPQRSSEQQANGAITSEPTPAPALAPQAPLSARPINWLRSAEAGLAGLFVILLGLTLWARRQRGA